MHADDFSAPVTVDFLRQALESLKREIFSSLHVAMPGFIESFDPESGTAAVQPALRRRTAAGNLLTAPLLADVPVFLPDPGFTPAAGDPCLLVFADFCVDGFLMAGQPVVLRTCHSAGGSQSSRRLSSQLMICVRGVPSGAHRSVLPEAAAKEIPAISSWEDSARVRMMSSTSSV